MKGPSILSAVLRLQGATTALSSLTFTFPSASHQRPLSSSLTNHFRTFRKRCSGSYEQLVTLANTNIDLPDVVGEIGLTRAYHNETTNTLERMVVQLRLESGEKVRLSAFDGHAKALHEKFSTNNKGPSVMLATAVNPKFFGGMVYLNATSGTKFSFDRDADVTQSLMLRLNGTSEEGDNYRRVQKIEPVTISELNSHFHHPGRQFLCTAAVIDIQTHNGWNYISCSKCGKKMTTNATTIACTNCHTSAAVGTVRYRVEMVVDDGTANSVFVAFDKDMEKLTRMQAAHLTTEMADANTEPEVLPSVLSELIGQKFAFHIKLSPFNFTRHHRSFTVSRIFDKPEDVPKPTFVTQGPAELRIAASPSARVLPPTTDPITENVGLNSSERISTTPGDIPSSSQDTTATANEEPHTAINLHKDKKPKLN